MTQRALIVGSVLTAVLLAAIDTATSYATFPGRNGKIVYSEDRQNNAEEANITLIAAVGSNPRRLTHDHSDYSPTFSPDGRHIAFVRVHYSDFGPIRHDIYAMGRSGRHLRVLRRNGSAPAYSPDGRRIAFATRRGGQTSIYVMRADGTHVRRLLSNADSPAFSPDGRRIAFASFRHGAHHVKQIYVMHSDGTHLRRLTTSAGDRPNFSPDSHHIAFSGIEEAYTIRADGTGLRGLTGHNGGSSPKFSPDGRHIVLQQGGWIAVMDMDGSQARYITGGRSVASDPDWQPRPNQHRVSLRWSLVRIAHGGRKITARFGTACPDSFKRVRARERPHSVTVAVIAVRHRLPPGTYCPAYLISAVASVRLHSPLGHRKLRHAHVTPGWPYS